MNDLQRRLAALSPQQRALLAKLQQGQGDQGPAAADYRPGDDLPLSFGQERMWMLSRLEPDSSAYHCPFHLEISGSLDPALLERALRGVVARHAVFRTRFRMRDGRVTGTLAERADLDLTVIDTGMLSAVIEPLMRTALASSFNLASVPLLRAWLWRTNADHAHLLVDMHHIVADAWSTDVLVGELQAAYRAGQSGAAEVLLPLTCQYADFAAWQRRRLDEASVQRAITFWRGHLDDPVTLQLPAPLSAANDESAQTLYFRIDAAVHQRLKQLALVQGCTVFMLYLSLFHLWLHRLSGQDGLAVGTPVANRDHQAFEPLIGFFVNMLAIRARPARAGTLADLLSAVRNQVLDAFQWKDFPFEKVIEALTSTRDLAHHPIFQAMFVYLPESQQAMSLPGLRMEHRPLPAEGAKFDVTWTVVETEDAADCSLEFDAGRADAFLMNQSVSRFQSMVAALANLPEQPLEQLDWLGADDRRLLLEQWSREPAVEAADQAPSLAVALTAQCRRLPDRAAIQTAAPNARPQTLTFDAFYRGVCRVAELLAETGIGPEDRVAVCLARTPYLPVVLWGITLRGAVFLPLESSHPPARLRWMCDNAEVAIILTEPRFAGVLSSSGKPILFAELLGSDRAEADDRAFTRPQIGQAHYLIYTSGSTGMPKGVIGTRQATLNRCRWMWRTLPFEDGERACHKTALGFVDSVWEIFGPTAQGIPILLIDDQTVRDTRAFLLQLNVHRISRLVVVPTLLRLLLAQIGDGAVLPYLRHLTVSGERLPPVLAHRTCEALPRVRLLNLYGSSEVAGDVTGAFISAGDDPVHVPIGRPIDDADVYVVDPQLRLVAPGMPGQLCIASSPLARGYWRRPALTAASFVPNPFPAANGQETRGHRLFLTGDRVRFDEQGVLHFLGRKDSQVKIHGQRLEPGEIEHHLEKHPRVAKAVVLPVPDDDGQPRLHAFISRSAEADAEHGGQQNTTAFVLDSLRIHLRQHLPAGHLPDRIHIVSEWTTTPNGKLDRQALIDQVRGSSRERPAYTAPQAGLETELAQLIGDTLAIGQVGRADRLLDLGAHSVHLIQIHTAIQQRYETKLKVQDLFDNPNLSELAHHIQPPEAPAGNVTIAIERIDF